jgi:uncharacterized protein involved in exopolysaccharide biosynthesis
VLRHSRAVAIAGLLAALGVTVYTLVRPREYTAESSFVPQQRRSTQGGTFSAIAAQLGLSMLTGDASAGPAFYADLLSSRELLERVVADTFTVPVDGANRTVTLVDWYHAKGETPGIRRDVAVEKLRRDLDAAAVQKTGVVRLRITLRNPALSAQVNQRLLDLLNEFNLKNRQVQAGEERRFTERRLQEVRGDLRAAEDRQAAFMARNREFQSSPELRTAYERLAREVSIQQQLFIALAQNYEQAKFDEVRDTPVISIVERPEAPARPDPRYLAVKAVVALFAGALVGLLGALLVEFLRRRQVTEAAAYETFELERDRAREEWGRLAPLSRVFGAARTKE